MGTTAGAARRRWLLVGSAVLVLCLVPAALAARPVAQTRLDPVELRKLMLASAALPYQGYVDSQARLGVPDLPELSTVVSLFSGTTNLRVWYGSAKTWRVAVLGPTGERDIYQTPAGTHVWDFERNAVNETAGDLPIRLPSGADLLPPTMARRLLGAARDAPMVGIASRRIAGISAAGLRMTPADPDTTVGSVSIWADPRTGLPLQVEMTARGADTPVVSTRFIELAQTAPDPGLLAPVIPDQAGFSVTSGQRVLDALGTLSPVPLPPVVANRSRTPGVSTVVGVGSYGDGLSTFVVVSLRGRNGARTFEKIRDSGAIPLAMAGGQAYQAAIPLLSMLVVRADGPRGRIYLLAGAVTPELLAQAGAELLAPR